MTLLGEIEFEYQLLILVIIANPTGISDKASREGWGGGGVSEEVNG